MAAGKLAKALSLQYTTAHANSVGVRLGQRESNEKAARETMVLKRRALWKANDPEPDLSGSGSRSSEPEKAKDDFDH